MNNANTITTPIFTIGYGQRSVDALLTDLRTHQIQYLIDIRSQPEAPHDTTYSQSALRQSLESQGIRYVFMGHTLGGACNGGDPNAGTGNGYEQGITRLQKAFQQQQRVALMCREGNPAHCRRAQVIGRTLDGLDIPVRHIDESGQIVEQKAVSAPPPMPDDPFGDEFDGWLLTEYDNGTIFYETPLAEMSEDPAAPFFPDYGLPSLPAFPHDPATLLRQMFGYDTFRPLQEDIITSVLDGQDALAIMPTGSGKSLCYQLPALLLPGLTVVVSPLISLMEDQVTQLRESGIPAVALNSSLDYSAYQWTVEQIRAGTVKLLYAAPETLLRPDVLLLLEQVRVDCLTIDEAHCISEWGHDFRPEYRQLISVRRRLPHAVCLAVTATATARVRHDIKTSLSIADANEFIASFDRENLFLAVEPKTNTVAQTLAFLQQHRDESGIIYCATRRQVDDLAAQLQSHGWDALPYHAGMDTATRQRNQRQFTRDDTPIIVATVAFGMGINKSNVRFILHVDLPKNLESYYQQIGRAGRDELRADCLLLYSYQDVNTINFFISQQAESQQRGARLRLEAMLGFIETNECRRRPLLAYFNETFAADGCEMCDNCTTAPEALVDITIPAQKFLSCVKRTGEIFGTNHIIDVLRGSRATRVLSQGHDRLSTYNIGGEFSKKEWQYLARQFIQQGLLVQDPTYGSLKLTAKAYAVFRGENVEGMMMETARRETTAALPHDAELFQRLRAHRKALADAANVAPYVIFSDRTLVEMAAYYPQSNQRFATLYGVGALKLEKYADSFLGIIRTYCAERGIEEKRRPAAPGSGGGNGRSRRQEVVEMWNEGSSLDDLAAHFQVKFSTLLDHLWKTARAGETLRPDSLLAYADVSAADQQRALAAFAAHGPDFLRPVYETLGETVPYEALHVLRLHHVLNNRGNG